MNLRSLSRFGARLLSVFLLAGCARDAATPLEPDTNTSNTISTEQFQQSASLLGLLPVRGVTRVVPLQQNISVSAVIDQAGGTISIPDAGLTLVVPPGAVTSSTNFTATALAGRLAAYEFEPHGTKFAVPLRFTQDLKKLSLLGVVTAPVLDGAYFTDASRLNQAAGLAAVSEIVPATVDLLRLQVGFPINHFSGYLVSWH
jgi:ZU5 domain-containing protein